MRTNRTSAASALERIEAIVANPAVFELAELIPLADLSRGGRPRHYPDYMTLIFEALMSVYGSARRVEVELAHRTVWTFLQKLIRRRFPKHPHRWLHARDRVVVPRHTDAHRTHAPNHRFLE